MPKSTHKWSQKLWNSVNRLIVRLQAQTNCILLGFLNKVKWEKIHQSLHLPQDSYFPGRIVALRIRSRSDQLNPKTKFVWIWMVRGILLMLKRWSLQCLPQPSNSKTIGIHPLLLLLPNSKFRVMSSMWCLLGAQMSTTQQFGTKIVFKIWKTPKKTYSNLKLM